MKLIIAMLLMTLSAMASEVPAYLKDGTITVTLKNGKQYTFSANEYMVVKRGAKSPKLEMAQKEVEVLQGKLQHEMAKPKRLKHIVSGEVVHSNARLQNDREANSVNVRTKKDIGVGLQYQYNIYQDMYMGGRLDSNGGSAINLGLGF